MALSHLEQKRARSWVDLLVEDKTLPFILDP